MKVDEYVKIIFEEPNMSDNMVNTILYGCTGFPCFWIGNPIRCLTKQLRHAKRALAKGFTIDQIYLDQDRCK